MTFSFTCQRVSSVFGLSSLLPRLSTTIQSIYTGNVMKRSFKVAPKAPEPPRRVNIQDLQKWKQQGRKIVMITAYDYPSAVHADLAEIDVVLVGDSVAMVALGHDTTQKVKQGLSNYFKYLTSIAIGYFE
jgi:hypothetical protein